MVIFLELPHYIFSIVLNPFKHNMKNLAVKAIALFMLASCSNEVPQVTQPVDLVNPFIDTHNSRWFYFSSATRPFGMVNLSPDTDTKTSWSSGYLYDSKTIRCFSHVHAWQLAGIAVMPTVGKFKGHLGMDAYQSAFSHDHEVAKPGYHQVELLDYKINAEVTATTRVGFHKYSFPESDSSYILFDIGAYLAHGPTVGGKIKKINNTTIAGYQTISPTIRRPKPVDVFFYAVTDKPFEELIYWKDSTCINAPGDSLQGKGIGAGARFKTQQGDVIRMKVALSYVSEVQARKNLERELPHWDFDQVKEDASTEWNTWLSKIKVEGGSQTQQVKFYTDLWHALQGRRIISDVDGSYRDNTTAQSLVKKVRLNKKGEPLYPHYNFDAWWGSHWSLNILWSMAYPELMDGFCNTMVDMYRNGGILPRGPAGGNYTFVMIGDPSVSFFATAYNKGIKNYDVDLAYEGLRKNAFQGGIRDRAGYEHGDSPTGGGMSYYEERGYVPEGIQTEGFHADGASMTLEYAYQDWCLAQMAKHLGKNDDYDFFMKRSQNYKNLWNDSLKYMVPRKMDGSFIDHFTPVASDTVLNSLGFCEANSSIYTHYVPHDIKGLIALFGSNEAYVDRLSEVFEKGKVSGFVGPPAKHGLPWVDYGNQPSTGMAHIFNYAGAPWLSQKWVREVKAAFNVNSPYGGYDGDEDQGQMGALGALLAMGLFEFDGGASVDPVYEITSPIFDKITIQLDNRYYKGNTFVIETVHNSDANMYIQEATLNGKPLETFYFPHREFANGGTLQLVLGPEPNKAWGK